jgi:Flp pilus assembly protein TadD
MFSAETVAATQAHLAAARTSIEGRRLEEGVVSLRAALALMPVLPEAHFHLGNALFGLGRLDEAEAEYRQAIHHAEAQKRRYAEPYVALGHLYGHRRETGRAVEAYAQAVRIAPGLAGLVRLGEAQMRDNDHAAALATLQKALLLDKANGPLRGRIAHALIALGRPKAALALCAETLRGHPGDADAHAMRGLALLGQGHWAEGFRESTWRWQTAYFGHAALQTGRPAWTGEDPAGKTILAYAEQGAGDTIQFARFLAGLAARGAQVVAAVPRSLMRLVATVPGVAAVHDLADPEWPAHDFAVSMLDVPAYMMQPGEQPPCAIPYVVPPAGPAAPGDGVLAVGIVWACNPDNVTARLRNVDPAALNALADVAGVRYVSLQQDKTLPRPFPTIAEPGPFADFADTARAVAGLDLVIAPDTAVAHLAGALGKPVWVLLPAIAEWRWGEAGMTSPWYPAARLYRQKTAADWRRPVMEVKRDLQALAGAR